VPSSVSGLSGTAHPTAVVGLDRELSAARHRITGIDDQIHDHLLDLSAISVDAIELIIQAHFKVDVCSDDSPEHVLHRADHLVQIENLRP